MLKHHSLSPPPPPPQVKLGNLKMLRISKLGDQMHAFCPRSYTTVNKIGLIFKTSTKIMWLKCRALCPCRGTLETTKFKALDIRGNIKFKQFSVLWIPL